MVHPEPASRQVSSRALILAAAREELAERGYESATVRSIARRAGVDPGLIRHYFRGKAELVRVALGLDDLMARLGGRVGAQAATEAPGRRIYQLSTRFWDAEPLLAQAVFAASTSAEPEVRAGFVRMVDQLVARLSPGDDAGSDARLRAGLAVGALLGLWVTQQTLEPGERMPWAALEDAAGGGLDRLLAGS